MSAPPRIVFRVASMVHVALYHASKGRLGGSIKGMPVLLLTVTGRKTGSPHTTPVSYLQDGDSWVVTGSAGGANTDPQWFRNLRATDSATIQVGGTRTEVKVAVADHEQREALWQRLLEVAPWFGDYQKQTSRVIPVAVLSARGDSGRSVVGSG